MQDRREDAAPASPSSRAQCWLEARVHYRRTGAGGWCWRWLRYLLLEIEFLSWVWSDPGPTSRSCLLVTRRDTGAVLLRYDYRHFSEVALHLADLRQRLRDETVFDVTRQLGIAMEAIQGAGWSDPPSLDRAWIGHSKAEWRALCDATASVAS